MDLEVVEQNLLEDRKLGSESGIEDDILPQEDRESESCTISDVGSYVRYLTSQTRHMDIAIIICSFQTFPQQD